jgi:hypothetical protein
MSKLLDFYINGLPTDEGHLLSTIVVSWENQDWEECHDFIQWLFPLPEPSAYNLDAPLLDDEFIEKYKSSTFLKYTVGLVLERAFYFWGFPHKTKPEWFNKGDHNMLRMSRLIKFLRLIGEFQMAMAIYSWLDELDRLYPGEVPEKTWDFWELALYGKPFSEALKE